MRTTLLLIVCLYWTNILAAQNKPYTFAQYIEERAINDEFKIVTKDYKNGFVRVKVRLALASESPTTEGYQEYGVWNMPKGNMIGKTQTITAMYDEYSVPNTRKNLPVETKDITCTIGATGEEELNMNFEYLSNDYHLPVDDAYDKDAVKKAYQNALAKIQARGAEGTETIYAEIPRTGTSIGLYIVYGSELLNPKNQGLPIWKLKFGELVFNKATGKFTLKTL